MEDNCNLNYENPKRRRLVMNDELMKLRSHFSFGQNWASYAEQIGKQELTAAKEGLRRLLGGVTLAGKRLLDVGCGSGVHSLAALELGASEVVAVDLDPRSAKTARMLLAKYAPNAPYRVEESSVFDLNPDILGRFDIVYSWGVLHHTGDMDLALRRATAMLNERGEFLFALYRRTLICPFWRVEKRWYSRASRSSQRLTRQAYLALFVLGLWATGRGYAKYKADYHKARGMDPYHDLHDWLGGYPYESISKKAIDHLMSELELTHVRSFVRKGFSTRFGLFGSGCDEYVYARHSVKSRSEVQRVGASACAD
jgi:2-polyprenyl-3-methyl-5-hydroxy-6-metoxy-1,4-benzoquinol methylase